MEEVLIGVLIVFNLDRGDGGVVAWCCACIAVRGEDVIGAGGPRIGRVVERYMSEGAIAGLKDEMSITFGGNEGRKRAVVYDPLRCSSSRRRRGRWSVVIQPNTQSDSKSNS